MTLTISLAPARTWTPDEDEFLRANHGSKTIQQIADEMGRSRSSVRARITRLSIAKLPVWSGQEIEDLVALYTNAGSDGVLNLGAFAKSIGRDITNVSRKAKSLGLPTSYTRRTVEARKVKPRKFASVEELRAAQSVARKQWMAENAHPRGMAGKKHTDATRIRLSQTSKAAHLLVSEDELAARILRSMKTRRENQGSLPPQVARGSWKAGWRQVGDQRKYFRSRWEANYARYLQWLKENGQIADWRHEPETFWFENIKRGVRSYLPDFRVWENNGFTCIHEVKGWMDARSRTTLKRMAKYHPDQKIILIDGKQYRAIRLKVMSLIPGWEDAARDSHA